MNACCQYIFLFYRSIATMGFYYKYGGCQIDDPLGPDISDEILPESVDSAMKERKCSGYCK
jgi:hypothetical protein